MNSVQIEVKLSPNRIPTGGIRLSDAFEMVYRALTPDWQELSERCVRSCELEYLNSQEREEFGCDSTDDPHREEWEATGWAETAFRKALHERQLSACIYTRSMGTILELDPGSWFHFGRQPGIRSDFTAPSDPETPGPDCTWNGVRQPVFLMRKPFLAWLSGITQNPSSQGVFLNPAEAKLDRGISVGLHDAEVANSGGLGSPKSVNHENVAPDPPDPDIFGWTEFDIHDPDNLSIAGEIAAGKISSYVVAYFLKHYIDRPALQNMTQRIETEINDFFKTTKRLNNLTASRKTVVKGHRLAMRIAKKTRLPAHWVALGVPNLDHI